MATSTYGEGQPAPIAPTTKRQKVERVFADLWAARSSYEDRWWTAGDYMVPTRPRRYDSDADRGDRDNSKLLDLTAAHAREIARAGLLAGMTNPSDPWFELALTDEGDDEAGDATREEERWLEAFRDKTLDVMARSNFYTSLDKTFADDLVFATGAFGIFEHPTKVIHCHSFPIGSYALANDHRGRVNTFARKLTLTVHQVVAKYGYESCSRRVQDLYDAKNYAAKVTVCHLIYPNERPVPGSPFSWDLPFKECEWEEGLSDGQNDAAESFLRESGYHEFPIIVSRWERNDEDAYGTLSPGILALPHVKMLNAMWRQYLNAVEHETRPPMLAPTMLQNSVVSQLPGKLTYYDAMQGDEGVRKLFDVQLRLDHLKAEIDDLRQTIRGIFMVDLFLMLLGDARAAPPTAEEVRAREREKLQVLGPVSERKAWETLDPAIERVTGIMLRASQGAWAAGMDGIVPLPPEGLGGREWRVRYVSEVAKAQKLVGLAGFERHMAFIGQTVQMTGDPAILDNIDIDKAAEAHGEMVGVSPMVRRSADEVAAIRARRAQDQAIAQAVEAAPDMARAAKDLSQADTEEPSVLSNLLGGR